MTGPPPGACQNIQDHRHRQDHIRDHHQAPACLLLKFRRTSGKKNLSWAVKHQHLQCPLFCSTQCHLRLSFMQCRSLGVETPAWCAAFWCSRYMQMSIVYFSKPLRYEERHDNNFVNKKYKQQWNAGEDHFGAAALRGAATAFQQTASVLASGEVACLYPTWLPSSRRCMMRRKWVAFHICASVSMRARWTCAHAENTSTWRASSSDDSEASSSDDSESDPSDLTAEIKKSTEWLEHQIHT